MKKILCVICTILMLSGCGIVNSKEDENEIPDFMGFSTDVYTEINDTKIEGSAKYTELDGLVLTLTSPETLVGMEIICKDSECKVDLHKLSFSVNYMNLPFNSIIVSLMACGENAKTSIRENECYKFSTNGYTYQLYLDETTNNFQKLMLDGNTILVFENFQYIMGQTDK